MLEFLAPVFIIAIWITILFVWLKLRKVFIKKYDVVCTQCGYFGEPEMHTQGSLTAEILLWFLFIIPGLIYSLKRIFCKIPACPKCGNYNLIPPDSPVAVKFLKELGQGDQG